MEKNSYVPKSIIEKLIKEFEQDIEYYQDEGYDEWEYKLSAVQEKIELLQLLLEGAWDNDENDL